MRAISEIPNLIIEWDFELNKEFDPNVLTEGSQKKVNWICKEGHRWKSIIRNRTALGRNCPYCSNQKVLTGYNDLLSKEPDLCKEWNYELNSITPSEVIAGTGKKYWWLCSKNHSWNARVSDRLKGNGCPYCSKKLILVGYNDLQTTNPEIANEWDYEKNGDLRPTMYSAGMRIKVWWKCSENHSYESSIIDRYHGSNCPYCSNKKALAGYNDFKTWCIDNECMTIVDEWNYDKNGELRPENVLKSSHKKVWWKCKKCGNEWSSAISIRTRKKNFNCPTCNRSEAKEILNKDKINNIGSLVDLYPKIVSEWDYDNNKYDPNNILPKSNKKVWWKCKYGHSYDMSVNAKVSGTGCPICANDRVLAGYNDICTTNPKLVEEWIYEKNKILPTKIIGGSQKKVWWKCSICDYEWEATVVSRNRGTGCPRCAKELQTSFPEQTIFYYIRKVFPDAINGDMHLGKELDIYIPSKKVAIEYDGEKWHQDIKRDLEKNRICESEGIILYRIRENGCPKLIDSNNVYEVLYNNDNELETAIKDIISRISEVEIDICIRRDRADIYSTYIVADKNNSLLVTNPEVLEEWDYKNNIMLSPSHVSSGSSRKAWWICDKGHSYQKAISAKVKGIGCPICHGNIILEGFNDFATWCKENNSENLIEEWDYEKNTECKPTTIGKGYRNIVWWKCNQRHSYQSYVYNRTKGVGCPYCAGKKTLRGYNDLETLNPNLAKEWNYDRNILKPYEVTLGSNKKVWWKCFKEHEWEATISHRTRGRGCPYCAGKIRIEK